MIHWTPQVKQAVLDNDFLLPEGADLAGLVDDLWAWLGSPDPRERDEVAYSVLATWIERGLLDGQLAALGKRAAADLGAPEVQRRTFATLLLAEVVGRDAGVRLVPAPRLHLWLAAWTTWYLDEPDLRSWDPQLGWLHAVAHGADTAGAFGQHPALAVDDLRRLLGTLAERLRRVDQTLVQGEDDRVALAAYRILCRPELGVSDLQTWLDALSPVWTTLTPGPIPPNACLTVHTLRALDLFLTLGVRRGDEVQFPAERGAMQSELRRTLATVYPFYGPVDGS
jgi:Protein of unknown function (DUF2785)